MTAGDVAPEPALVGQAGTERGSIACTTRASSARARRPGSRCRGFDRPGSRCRGFDPSCGATRGDLWCLTAPIAVFLPLPDDAAWASMRSSIEANIGRANIAPRAAANIAPRAAEPRCRPQLKLHCKSRRSRPTRTTPAVFASEREDSVFRSLCWTSLKHIWGESFASSVFCIIMILPSYSLFICLLKLRSEANHSPSGRIM